MGRSYIRRTTEECLEIASRFSNCTELQAAFPGVYTKLYKEGLTKNLYSKYREQKVSVTEKKSKSKLNTDTIAKLMAVWMVEENKPFDVLYSELEIPLYLKEEIRSKISCFSF